MIQLLNIKKDELLYFMDSYAFTGQSIDKKALIPSTDYWVLGLCFFQIVLYSVVAD